MSAKGRIGPDEELALGSGFGESWSSSSLGFLRLGVGVGDDGVLGSGRFVDCGCGVAGCRSSKSSNLTVLGLSGVCSLIGLPLDDSTTSKGERVRSCAVGVAG